MLLLFLCNQKEIQKLCSNVVLRFNYILIAITECFSYRDSSLVLTKMLGKYNGLVVPKHLSFGVQVNPKEKQLDLEKKFKGNKLTSILQFRLTV